MCAEMKCLRKCFPKKFKGLAWIIGNTIICQIIFYYFNIKNCSLCSINQKLSSLSYV